MLLHTDQLDPGYSIVAEMDYIFDRQRLFVVTSSKELVFVKKSPAIVPSRADEPGGIAVFQTEFPLGAAQWFVKNVEEKLWRSAAEGGLPSGVNHIEEEVDGEKLKLRRTMGAGGPGQKGFYFINLSRPSIRHDDKNRQEIIVSDALLKEGGLMDILKGIAAKAHN